MAILSSEYLMRELFAKRPQPYYIYAYDYRRNSAGVRVMHMLCDALNRSGQEAYVVTQKTDPGLMTPCLNDGIVKLHGAQGMAPIAVYPEIVDGNPLQARTVVRYLLNRPGFIEGKGEYAEDDILFAYTQALLQPGMPGDRVLHLPATDSRVFRPPEDASKRIPGKVCYYQGRRGQAVIDPARLPSDAVEITPHDPESWEALADLFQQCEFFYSGEASGLAMEANLCGCVSVVQPGAWAPRNISGNESLGVAWGFDPAEIERARHTVPLVREALLRQQAAFWPALDRFIEITQSAAREREEKAARQDSLRQWLEHRVPSPAQLRLIGEHLAAGAAPAIGVLVLDPQGRPVHVQRTLASLERAARTYAPARTVVLASGAESLPPDSDAARRFVRLDAGESLQQAINRVLAQECFDWFVLVNAGDEFTSSGLMILAQELAGADGVRAVYADEMMRNGDGKLSALLRPDFNLDLLLSMPAGMGRRWLFRREVVLEAGGFDPTFAEAPEFELLLRLIDAGGTAGLGHVDEPLLIIDRPAIASSHAEQDALRRHLRHRGYEQASVAAHLPGCYRIDYGHQDAPGVSIIIPTRNLFSFLLRCVESLLEKTAYKNYEVLIVDNGSSDDDACAWLAGIEAMDSTQLRVLRYPHPFNHSAMVNMAASQARGDYLLLLDNDVAILREDWLDALLNHAQRPEVGVVGAKLLGADGNVQQAGLVLGLRGPAEPVFRGEKLESPGYMYRLQVDQNYSTVAGSCLMIRKSLFEEVGGLDEDAFKRDYNDADLCLKVREAGYLVVWTPHAVLLHEGGASLVKMDEASPQEQAARRSAAQDAMYGKWLPLIARDPAYNQNLSLQGQGFQLDADDTLSWRPLRWRPLPVALAYAADQQGCGHYRIMQPARAMNDFGLADARFGDRYNTPVEMERLAPDTLVLQRQMVRAQIELQKRLARFSRCFKVAELDDYLPNVPIKSAHKGQLPKDILKTMREALKLVDRFVVSTAPLAEAFDGLHPDIRVVENHLPMHWWSELRSLRRQGRRPRVGWGGGVSHRGDLELIADVVKALAGEVEWVFFGMCPDSMRPYIHEFHAGVAIDDYPARLASLNLDVAIAPLEDNLFNQCKSNLRLLELGACGFPVVCSDVRPYQGDLPVTRVKPRFKDWVDAIRMHTHDLDAAAKAGDTLRDAVHRDWMLDEKHAAFWLSQWLPD